jgi:hypothetical protein
MVNMYRREAMGGGTPIPGRLEWCGRMEGNVKIWDCCGRWRVGGSQMMLGYPYYFMKNMVVRRFKGEFTDLVRFFN